MLILSQKHVKTQSFFIDPDEVYNSAKAKGIPETLVSHTRIQELTIQGF